MGYWRGHVGRGLTGSLPSFRRAAQRRSAPRLDEGSVPGMDFGAESTAVVQGGEYCGTWLRVGGGWLGVGFGSFRDRCIRLASREGWALKDSSLDAAAVVVVVVLQLSLLLLHFLCSGKCTEKLWGFIHTSEHHMLACRIKKVLTTIQFKVYPPPTPPPCLI